MDWAAYKLACDRPEVLSRWLLERTVALLDVVDSPTALRAALEKVLAQGALPRPVDHAGPPATDMFPTRLDAEQAALLLGLVTAAAEGGVLQAVLEGRSMTGFIAAWREYAAWTGPVDGRAG